MANITELKNRIYHIIALLLENPSIKVSEHTPLTGNDSPLDSVKLVELCLVLEETAADLGFQFDWTSNSSMSKSRTMFASAGNLADIFISQYQSKI